MSVLTMRSILFTRKSTPEKVPCTWPWDFSSESTWVTSTSALASKGAMALKRRYICGCAVELYDRLTTCQCRGKRAPVADDSRANCAPSAKRRFAAMIAAVIFVSLELWAGIMLLARCWSPWLDAMEAAARRLPEKY